MRYDQNWQGARVHEGRTGPWFPVSVPGNIQADYGRFMNWPDVNFGDNCRLYEALEDDTWLYRTHITCPVEADRRVFFVTKGIEYEYEIRMGGRTLCRHEGMFSPLELDITEELKKDRPAGGLHSAAPEAGRGGPLP